MYSVKFILQIKRSARECYNGQSNYEDDRSRDNREYDNHRRYHEDYNYRSNQDDSPPRRSDRRKSSPPKHHATSNAPAAASATQTAEPPTIPAHLFAAMLQAFAAASANK